MYGTNSSEAPELGFNDSSIRQGFIRKVYSILTVQLLITASFISIFVFYKPAAEYAINNFWLFIVAIVVLFTSMIALACCGEVRRKTPINYILLGLFTLAETFMLCCVASLNRGDTVLMAVGITAILCFALTLFAFQTKIDFTICKGFLFIAVILLIVFGVAVTILSQYGGKNQILYLVYATVGALIFSVYLIVDTQLMMGGEHKYSISPEEYIFAALNLYVDIVNIFIYILTILAAAKS